MWKSLEEFCWTTKAKFISTDPFFFDSYFKHGVSYAFLDVTAISSCMEKVKSCVVAEVVKYHQDRKYSLRV